MALMLLAASAIAFMPCCLWATLGGTDCATATEIAAMKAAIESVRGANVFFPLACTCMIVSESNRPPDADLFQREHRRV